MINPQHFKDLIVVPVNNHLGMSSKAATNLMMGTVIKESGCGKYLKQLEGGPALGPFEMEPTTHHSVWVDYLAYHPALRQLAESYLCMGTFASLDYKDSEIFDEFIARAFGELAGNLYYSAAMARIRYWWISESLPEHDDIYGLAMYWKKYYNTADGKGTVKSFVEEYNWVMSGVE